MKTEIKAKREELLELGRSAPPVGYADRIRRIEDIKDGALEIQALESQALETEILDRAEIRALGAAKIAGNVGFREEREAALFRFVTEAKATMERYAEYGGVVIEAGAVEALLAGEIEAIDIRGYELA